MNWPIVLCRWGPGYFALTGWGWLTLCFVLAVLSDPPDPRLWRRHK